MRSVTNSNGRYEDNRTETRELGQDQTGRPGDQETRRLGNEDQVVSWYKMEVLKSQQLPVLSLLAEFDDINRCDNILNDGLAEQCMLIAHYHYHFYYHERILF